MKKVEINKNICFINTNKEWGGGEKWHFEAACFFLENNWNVFAITHQQSELYQRLLKTKVQLHPVKITKLSFMNPLTIKRLSRYFRENDIRAVVLNLPSDAKAAGFAAKKADVQHIIYRRGMALPVKNSIENRYLFKNVLTKVIANSEEIKRTILLKNKNLIPEGKIEIIYNGIDTESILYKQKRLENKLVIGSAGRFVKQKGQKFLIDLAAILKQKNFAFEIRLAGTGKEEQNVKNYARFKKVDDCVLFLGFVARMEEFFNSIDIFILPSLHEGSSNVLLEAMAYLKPVICFNLSSMPEMVEHNRNGFLIPFPDVHLMAQKIIELNNHRELIAKMGQESRAIIESKFNKKKNFGLLIKDLLKE
ncbi:MAG TPA: glycosyltransferase family 4 protein [Smithella sp.]|nr:glycosyltransferase family 4 protein [Smithella sp.]HNY49693.1 glycosyltransferase family 4 protein [Smithella sp.]HOG89261.1 glycosyltransferase family 4 protein [Smithella sp.]HOU50853.1 glycosyltransferase family 4 protein [Smithella sp.]HQG64880.1 glycosyltransferase family 4 protein [Smithella sp.]